MQIKTDGRGDAGLRVALGNSPLVYLGWAAAAVLCGLAAYALVMNRTAQQQILSLQADRVSAFKAAEAAVDARKKALEDVERMKAAEASASQRAEALQSEATQMKADLRAAADKVTASQQRITVLETERNELKSRATANDQQTAELRTAADTAAKAKAQAEARVASLQKEIDLLKTNLADSEHRLKEVQARLDEALRQNAKPQSAPEAEPLSDEPHSPPPPASSFAPQQ